MKVSIKIDGLKEMDKALRGLGAELGAKTLRGALMDAATPMLNEMKALVPIDKGGLKKTLGKRSKIDKKGVNAPAIIRVGAVRKGAWKAHFIEFGTSRTPAQPFIRPAFDKSDEVIQRFKSRLGPRIEKAARKLAKKP